jgi:hypothetical protein
MQHSLYKDFPWLYQLKTKNKTIEVGKTWMADSEIIDIGAISSLLAVMTRDRKQVI